MTFHRPGTAPPEAAARPSGASKDFGVGLEDAVACAEYGNYFNLSDSVSARLREFQHKLAVSAPSAFPTMAGPR
jgi:hypothetical protein